MPLLSVKQTSELLGMSPQRTRFYIRRGDLPANSVNGHDYIVDQRDALAFAAIRRPTGRPNRAQLRELEAVRQRAAQRRERLRRQRAERVAVAG